MAIEKLQIEAFGFTEGELQVMENERREQPQVIRK